jgi:predicted ATPase/DNA-binding XRE family transcriptional regulator
MERRTPSRVGELVRRRRIAAALSQEALAERAGLSVRAVSDLERGVHQAPRLESLRLLAEALGLDAAGRAELLAAAQPQAAVPDVKEHARPQASTALPVPPTRLIGREAEAAAVARHLADEDVRLLTLTGPGGSGKTRLALEVAAALRSDIPDGVWFLDLAGLTDPTLLLPQIAATLAAPQNGERSVAEGLADHFAGKRVLLVLDNLEQFRPYDALGRAIVGVLDRSPGVTILATSRSPLHLRVEREAPLAPLPVPPPNASTVAALAESPAVQLFVTRAQAVRPGFTLTPQNAAAIADLCRRLDGLPLALELAAARVRTLAPADIVDRLQRRLDLLADSGADRPDRQRTLEATIAWSYDLLTPDQRAAFRRLAVFSGGFTLDAAEAAGGRFAAAPPSSPLFPPPSPDVLDLVTALVEQGLLRDEEQADGTLRFRMLETVRAFGLDRLRDSGEEDAARRAHAAVFRALIARGFADADALGEDVVWLARLDAERDNLRAALEATVASDPGALLAFVVGCWQFWWPRGYWTEARMWLEQALAHGDDIPSLERATALRALGLIADAAGDRQKGLALLEESRQLFADLKDRRGEWQTLLDLSLLWAARDYGQAGPYAEQALAVAREAGDPVMIARSLNRLGNWHGNREQSQEAFACHREALRLLEELGDKRGIAETLDLLGAACEFGADLGGVTHWYGRAIAAWREIGDQHGLVNSLIGAAGCAHSHYFHGNTQPAMVTLAEGRRCGEESLAITRELGWRAGEASVLWGYRGLMLGAAGEHTTALPSARQALAIARDIDHAQWTVAARFTLGSILADLGDFPAAQEELRGALSLAQEIASPFWVRMSAGALVSALAGDGRHDEAAVALDGHLSDDTPMTTLAGRNLWASAADLALATGDSQQALQLADRLIQTLLGAPSRPIPRLELLRGQALTALGHLAEAEQALQAAHEAAVWCSARPLQWRVLAAQVRLAEAQGNPTAAEQARAAAHALVAQLAADVPDDDLRAVFRAYALQQSGAVSPEP